MKIVRSEPDSKILDKNIYQIAAFEATLKNYIDLEKNFLEDNLVDCFEVRIPVNQIKTIHIFESHAFRFAEMKIIRKLTLEGQSVSENAYYPFKLKPADDTNDLKEVLKAAKYYLKDDRFSLSGKFSKTDTLKRIRYFLKKACDAEDEFLLCLNNEHSGEIIGYQSGQMLGKNEVKLFLSGLKKDYNNKHYLSILNTLTLSWLSSQNVRYVNACSSSVNLNEMNIAFQLQGYYIDEAYIVLQKWFN